jgi:hypothetical protein
VKLAPLAFAAIALGSAPAAAKPLFTPPVGVSGTATAGCIAQNLTTKPRNVGATLRNQDGTALMAHEDVVPPGAVLTFVAGDADFGFYCEFDGLGKGVRGYIHVYDSNTLGLYPATK